MAEGESNQRPASDKWSEALADAVDHVRTHEAAEDQPQEPRPNRKPVMLGEGVALLVLVWGWNLYYLTRPLEPLSPEEQLADLREEASYYAEEIQLFFSEEGRLPTLAETEMEEEEGLEYRVVDSEAGRFQVIRREENLSVTYDGSIPLRQWVSGSDVQGGPR
ncbi:hypothetical protein ACFL3S_05725 [Gemmatimonadota bacterium]